MESQSPNYNSKNHEEHIKLLEERLKVERKKDKVGEVIIRKETETKIAFVPLEQEKLIVEQVNADNLQVEKIAEVDLKTTKVGEQIANQEPSSTIKTKFDSLQEARNYLQEMPSDLSKQVSEIEIKLTIDDNLV